MLAGMQETALKQMMEQEIRTYAGTMAAMEYQQRVAMRALAADCGADVETLDLDEPPEVEERVDELVDAIVAHQTGDLWTLYVDHLAPDALENADRAKQYAGLDAEEWEAKIEQWAQKYRDRAGDAVADRTDRDLADVHTRETFGLDLDAFEEEVVEREPARVLQEIVAGPFETNTEAVWSLAGED